MEIKQQALEAARAATDIDLTFSSKQPKSKPTFSKTTAAPPHRPRWYHRRARGRHPVSIAAEPPRPNPFNPDSLPVSLDKRCGRTSCFGEGADQRSQGLGYAEPDMDTYLRMNSEAIARENAKVRMKKTRRSRGEVRYYGRPGIEGSRHSCRVCDGKLSYQAP